MSTSDSIALSVGGRRLERFLGYRIEADLFCADNYFRLELADPGMAVDPGMRCQLYVNGALALTGIIDRVIDGDDKRGPHMMVEGRDLMGLLVDSYVEEFPDVEDTPLKALAEQLLATVPFINRKAVVYQGGLAGAAAAATRGDAADPLAALGIGQKNTHVEPGSTVFDVLRRAAASRGATFFALPDGTFVFGRPKAKGAPAFNITYRTDGAGNNAFRATRMRDSSRRYSKITVVGQQQGDDATTIEEINVQASVTDDGAPYHKPYVTVLNDDAVSPAHHARQLLEMQRAAAFALVYSVAGHSQNGRNWTVNELCRARDAVRGIDGTYLVVSRAFELSKRDGRYTEIRLGLPGVIA